ncbi:MAG: alpha-hydroxy-acid oxidizing enzyme [Alphaproteobacteria bacterium]|nr:alpha-hydroxy-acid oxidizing enzyme [Alphaproteobacteria bacterium]|tara:strand:+ start:437 stop:1636 length:1200 start_codon:yes stop_codon:yes gene_type:complete
MSMSDARKAEWSLKYPTIEDLRLRGRRRTPRFAFDYVDGAVGASELNMVRNAEALDAIEIVPRYGSVNFTANTEVELFGETYAMPVAIAPMGIPSLVLPNGEEVMARAAQAHRFPLALGCVAGATVERIAELAPDNLWFQLYRQPANELAVDMDLVRRAGDVGVKVLIVTLDVPSRAKRPRERRDRLVIPYSHSVRTVTEALKHPTWLMAYLRHGMRPFANYRPYAGENASDKDVIEFVRRETVGAFTWDEVAQFRDAWPGPLVVKGLLHPGDAERAVSIGADGIEVSNHGGRQLEAAPPAIDCLPAVVDAIGGRAKILFDSGIRSGIDVVRAMALGADFTLAGRAFMYGLCALGEEGPEYVASFFQDEIAVAMRQIGVQTYAELRDLDIRHPGAFNFG